MVGGEVRERGWLDGGWRGVFEWFEWVGKEAYRLDGKGVFRRLLRAIGSNEAMCSSEGPGICIEDIGSTSSESSVMPLKVDALRLEGGRHWMDKSLLFFKGRNLITEGARWLVIVNVVD